MTTKELPRFIMVWPHEEMTMERARFVRRLRVDEDYTWRQVADACAEEWGGEVHPYEYGGNQIAGMEICDLAAEMCGERYMSPPWN